MKQWHWKETPLYIGIDLRLRIPVYRRQGLKQVAPHFVPRLQPLQHGQCSSRSAQESEGSALHQAVMEDDTSGSKVTCWLSVSSSPPSCRLKAEPILPVKNRR